MPIVRRVLVLVAAIAAAVVSGVAYVAPAHADVIDGAITDVQIREETADWNDRLTVDLDWCVPDDAREGDTFYLDLPPSLRGLNSSFELTNDEGDVIAQAVYVDGRVTFTLTALAEELNRVCGSAFFEVETVKTEIVGGEANDFEFQSNSDTFEDTVEIGERPTTPTGRPTPFKTGRWETGDQDSIGWRVETNSGPWRSSRMVDTVGPGQAIDCSTVTVRAGSPGDYVASAAQGRFRVESCTATTLTVSFVDAAAGEGFEVRYVVDITDPTLREYTNAVEVTTDGRAWVRSDDVDRSNAGGDGGGDVVPDIDIEKWSTSDGYPGGDFDDAPGKELTPGAPEPITLTVTNTGEERLVDVVVGDTTDAGPALRDLSCDFSPLGGPSTGTTWAGPFEPEASFTCTATLPGLDGGQQHADTADVTGTGGVSGTEVSDSDPWHGHVVAAPEIDIEKWSTGDGFPAGDFDDAPGKPVEAEADEPITLTITNTGNEPLVDVTVSDAVLHGPALRDLSCDFSALGGPSTGTRWEGPFRPGDSFECSGTVPGLVGGETHGDRAAVTGIGRYSGTPVDDADDWHAHVPAEPAIDIEKWSSEHGPVDGDFDQAPGWETTPDEPTAIILTVTNAGNEPLVDVVVRDRTDEGRRLRELSCDFSALGGPSTGTRWEGPFRPGDSFECSGTVPPLPPNGVHADTARVDAAGEHSGEPVEDDDRWHGYAPPVSDETTPPGPGLPDTGGPSMGLTVLGSALSLLGAAVLWRRRMLA